MKNMNSKILNDVAAKYQAKFPNLANSIDLLEKAQTQFKKRKKPKIIVKQKQLKDSKDQKLKSIQKAFKLKTRKNLTPYDCSIMLTGGPLISDDGYLYFLPRLLKHVLEDPIHEDLLNSRLKRLDTRNLSSDETAIVEKIKILADEIRAYSDMLKTKNG
jgi:hypothetical protein